MLSPELSLRTTKGLAAGKNLIEIKPINPTSAVPSHYQGLDMRVIITVKPKVKYAQQIVNSMIEPKTLGTTLTSTIIKYIFRAAESKKIAM